MAFSALLLFLLQLSFITATEDTAYGCDISSDVFDGFNATIYHFFRNDLLLANNQHFLSGGYLQQTVRHTTMGVTVPGFDIWNPSSFTATLFGIQNVNYFNMVVELKGYFKADVSGDYKLTLTNIDDSSMIFFGKEAAFQCCDANSIPLDEALIDYSLSTLEPYNEGTATSSIQYLEAGKYYPVRIVYVNALERAIFNFKVTLPDGTVLNDFKDYVYQFGALDESSCQETTVSKTVEWTTYTTPWTGTFETTRTIIPTGTEPGTVVIETPYSFVTTTRPWTGTYDTTYTVPPTGTEPGTVVIETPYSFVTTTRPWTGTYDTTYTVPPTGTEPGTVVIETPYSFVTTTRPWTGTYDTTYTVPPTGTEPGTVVIETPYSFVTTTRPWTGTYDTTYTVPPTGTEPGTVVIETPYSFVTTTRPWTGTYDTTYTVPPTGTEPGTVVIETPYSFVTTTRPWTGTYDTTYTVPPTGTEPGTVVIETPYSFVTTTRPWTGTYDTTYTVPPTGTEPGTVVIETPYSFVTTTRPWTGTYDTTYTVPPTGTEPGTVVIETPYSFVTTTRPWTGTYDTTYTVPPTGTEPGTVVIETPYSFVTTTRPWTGTYDTTYTVPPTGTEPGTVVIETPYSFVTTTRPWTGTYDTTYTVPPTGTEPGTVVIETPYSFVTTTRPWTGTYDTTYTVPPTGTEPGTVVIETPYSFVTTTRPWTGTYDTTYTVPPTGTEPGTVVIETPYSFVTTTRPWTGTYDTTYTVPPTGTEPGTVVIETPYSYLTATSTGPVTNVLQTPVPSFEVSDGVSALDGFNVVVFHYPADNYELVNEISFLSYGYQNEGLVTTSIGVNDINFDTDLSWPSYIDRNALRNTASYVNATIEYEGFFRAPVDGEYEFRFSNIDYNAILFVGGAAAADQSLQKREVQYLKPETRPDYVLLFKNARDSAQTIFTTQYLSADRYYPLRLVLVAVSQHALLDFQITIPDGGVLSEFQGYVYNFGLQEAESSTSASTSHETSSWTGFTNSTTISHSNTIGFIPTSTDRVHPIIDPTAIETTSTEIIISTAVVTVTSCDIQKCTETTALTGVTPKTLTAEGTTSVITTYCPLPTHIASLKTTTISDNEVVQTAYSAKPNQFTPNFPPSTVTITREVCDAYGCTQATIVTGEILQTRTVVDADSATVIPVYVPVDSHQPSIELSTPETALQSSGTGGSAVTIGTPQLSPQSGWGVKSSVAVSKSQEHSTSVSVSQLPPIISLQTGQANALRWSAFVGAAVIPLLNMLFI